ncbi:hypothetical protein [Paraburkholderia ferrariae]|uniref:Helix-turn-helix domain-containing protein n=1 Tax=Paraburkholderia ferrariae TaxID=386056 RepID=A0ABU9RIG1_9BURK
MGRDKARRGARATKERFVGLPFHVLHSAAYRGLPHVARSLLIDIAEQYKGDNNGQLLASRAHLEKLGWHSAGVIHKNVHVLEQAGLLYQTVKGGFPNTASWYALTWRDLNDHDDYDDGKKAAFVRNAHLKPTL